MSELRNQQQMEFEPMQHSRLRVRHSTYSFLHDSTSELPVRTQQTLIIICVHGILYFYHMVGISFS